MFVRLAALAIAVSLIWAQPLAEIGVASLHLAAPDLGRSDVVMGANFFAGPPAFCLVWLAEWLAWRRGEDGWDWNLFRTGAMGALVFAAGVVLALSLVHAVAAHHGTLRSTASLDFLFLPFVAWKASVVGFLVGLGFAAMVTAMRAGEGLADNRGQLSSVSEDDTDGDA